jgi:hypothetical protein
MINDQALPHDEAGLLFLNFDFISNKFFKLSSFTYRQV